MNHKYASIFNNGNWLAVDISLGNIDYCLLSVNPLTISHRQKE